MHLLLWTVSVLIPFLFDVLFYLSRLPLVLVRQTAVSPSGKQPECSRCVGVTELSLPVSYVIRNIDDFEANNYGHSTAKSCSKFAAGDLSSSVSYTSVSWLRFSHLETRRRR